MTRKLFYEEPHLYEWNTEITEVEWKDPYWQVQLKETAFYPEGGGQPADFGTIDGLQVIDVRKENDEVYHLLNKKPENHNVHCKIDYDRRWDHTQHHSCQHLLSAVCLELYNAETLSFHLGSETVTIDLNVTSLTPEQLVKIEKAVNRYILENRKINIFYIDSSNADKYPLRKIPSGHKRLRIVEIEGIEFNACGGTHVQSLGEIAMMKLIKTEKIRGSVRLHFICGTRLLKDYSKNLDIINSIVHKLTTSPTQLQNQIDKIIAENKEFNRKNHLLFEQYAELLGEKLLDEQQGPVIWQLFDDYSIKDLTIISQKIASMSDKVILAGSRSELRIVMAHNGNNSIHLGQFVKENISRFSGKGGGDANKAQVLFSDEEQLQAFADYTKMHIISN